MTTMDEVLSWVPSDLTTIAATFTTQAESLRAMSVELSAPITGWLGGADAEAAAKTLADMASRLNILVLGFDTGTVALNTAAAQIAAAQADIQAAKLVMASAIDAGYRLASSGSIVIPTAPDFFDPDQKAAVARFLAGGAIASKVAEQVAAAIELAKAADEALAAQLASAFGQAPGVIQSGWNWLTGVANSAIGFAQSEWDANFEHFKAFGEDLWNMNPVMLFADTDKWATSVGNVYHGLVDAGENVGEFLRPVVLGGMEIVKDAVEYTYEISPIYAFQDFDAWQGNVAAAWSDAGEIVGDAVDTTIQAAGEVGQFLYEHTPIYAIDDYDAWQANMDGVWNVANTAVAETYRIGAEALEGAIDVTGDLLEGAGNAISDFADWVF